MRSPGVLWIKAAVVYLMMGVGLSGDRHRRIGLQVLKLIQSCQGPFTRAFFQDPGCSHERAQGSFNLLHRGRARLQAQFLLLQILFDMLRSFPIVRKNASEHLTLPAQDRQMFFFVLDRSAQLEQP